MKAQTFALLAAAFAAAPAMVHGQATVLIPWTHDWNFYHPVDGIDPNGTDTDFNDTWFLKSGPGAGDFEAVYNGPTFNGPSTAEYDSGVGPGPLGYDIVNYFNAAGAEFTTWGTTLTLEPSRAAMYFRTTFNVPAGGMANPSIRYLFDDGTFIYIDGVLVARVNINASAANTTAAGNLLHQDVFAADATATEDALATLNLGVQDDNAADQITVPNPILFLPAGQHTIAVTLRSNSATSSDGGMALELSATPAPPCVVGANASNVQRQTQGTPGAGDDTFSFDVAVTANGGSPLGWTTTLPAGGAGPASGTYPANVNYTLPATGPVTLSFVDRADASCNASVTVTPPDLPRTTIIPWTHEWKFYHPLDGTDPSIADTDFNDTWFLKSGAGAGDFEAVYNGPSFDGPGDPALFDAGTGPGPLGYDVLGYFGTAGAEFTGWGTTMTLEGTGTRQAMYFRSTFTVPAGGMSNLAIRYIFDDGTFIYIDGVLVARVNINASAANTTAAGNLLHQDIFAADATVTEDQIDTLRLDTLDNDTADQITVPNPILVLPAGTHTIAVTLRSNSATSSDGGMALELAGSPAPSCVLGATPSNVQRQTLGTPAPGDDTFSFNVNVAATGGSAGGWTATLPAGAAGPASGAYGANVSYTFPIAQSVTITFRDSADVSCTAALTVNAPGVPVILTATTAPVQIQFQLPPVGANSFVRGFADPVTPTDIGWTAGVGAVTADVTPPNQYLQANNARWARFETEPVDVQGVTDFSASLKLAAYTTSGTGFEADDTMQAFVETSTDGATWTALVPPIVDAPDGTVLFNEIFVNDGVNTTGTGYVTAPTIPFTVTKTANYPTGGARLARIVITGGNNSASEFLLVDDVKFALPACGVNVAVSNAFRAPNAPGAADDTFSFTVNATNALGAAPAGYDTNAPGLAHGNYGTNYVVGPFPATGPAVITFTDSATAGCSTQITVNPPRLLELGQLTVGPTTTIIYNDPAVAPPAAWVAGAAPFTVVQTNGGGTVAHVLASEMIDLSAINGAVNFTARLVAEENSDGTNFETDDTFKIDLELNGPGGPTTVPLVTAAMDVGDGAAGAANGPPNGVLNGYTEAVEADYQANVARDELNATGAGWIGISGRTVDFTHVIPDSATSARLVITALNNSASETFTVSNVVFTTGPVGPLDTDGDGQSDASEVVAGTDPNDPNDYLRFTGISRAGAGASATFASEIGKNYQAEVSSALGSGWTAFGPVTAGTGADITVNIPQVPITPADLKYFLRVRVVP